MEVWTDYESAAVPGATMLIMVRKPLDGFPRTIQAELDKDQDSLVLFCPGGPVKLPGFDLIGFSASNRHILLVQVEGESPNYQAIKEVDVTVRS